MATGLSVTIATVTGNAAFTNAQAEKFVPPLLRKHEWPGETVWANMTAQERQDVCDFLAGILVWEAAKAARVQTVQEGVSVGGSVAGTDYDATVADLLVKPSV